MKSKSLTNFDKQLIQYIHDYGYEVIGRDLRGFIYVTNSKGQSEYLNCISSALKSLGCGCSVFIGMMM